MSWGPKVQFLLVGKEINLALSVTGAKRRKFREDCYLESTFHSRATCDDESRKRGKQQNAFGGTVPISDEIHGSTEPQRLFPVLTECTS